MINEMLARKNGDGVAFKGGHRLLSRGMHSEILESARTELSVEGVVMFYIGRCRDELIRFLQRERSLRIKSIIPWEGRCIDDAVTDTSHHSEMLHIHFSAGSADPSRFSETPN